MRPREPASSHDDDLEDLFENAPCGYRLADGRRPDPAGQPDPGHLARLRRRRSWSGARFSGPAEHRRQDLLRDPFRAAAADAGLLQRGRAGSRAPGRRAACRSWSTPSSGTAPRRTRGSSASPCSTPPTGAATSRSCCRRAGRPKRPAPSCATQSPTSKRGSPRPSSERMKAEEALRQAQKMEADRPAHGRRGARFQQPADRDPGRSRHDRAPARRRADARVAQAHRARRATWPRTARERAAALTARLLAFARRQPLDPEPSTPPPGHRPRRPAPAHARARRRPGDRLRRRPVADHGDPANSRTPW